MKRYEELSAKARAALDASVQKLGPTMPDKPRDAASTPPDVQGLSVSVVVAEYDQDSIMMENRALRRRLEMLAEREQQRNRTPTIKPR